MTQYRNPVIPGCNPDPSICRVGEDYYLVVSSFEFFPGLPLYHSRNLVNWELIGHCLDKDEKLNLRGCPPSGGLYAPALTYHNDTFFLTCTNVSDKGNFIIHTKDIRGGWSDPVWVDQTGIDPSLFFDVDGKVYFLTAFGEVYISEIDPFTGKRKSDVRVFNKGCGGKNPEAPHIYRIDGRYYLLLAEGGTEYGHRGTIQRSDTLFGVYEPCPENPVFSNQDQTRINVHCIGHGDFVDDPSGNWWVVCLGIRTISDFLLNRLLHNLGREVFLAPVKWTRDGWPQVGEQGVIGLEMEGDLPGDPPEPICHDFTDSFTDLGFSPEYNFIRNPDPGDYIRDTDNQRLILKGGRTSICETDSPVFVGVRQKSLTCCADAKVNVIKAVMGMRIGLCAYYNENYHYTIDIGQDTEGVFLELTKHIHDIQVRAAIRRITAGSALWLRICADIRHYSFFFSLDGEKYELLGKAVTAGLCTETTMDMTYTGVYIGMFAERGTGSFEEFRVRFGE